MAGLHQLNITFNPGEDRLLLRLTADEGKGLSEFRFWLTRRFVSILWQALEQVLDKEVMTAAPTAAVSQTDHLAMKEFQRESALEASNFSIPYAEETPKQTPLGENPLLVSKLQVRRLETGQYILVLHDANNQGINLTVNLNIIHSLRKLLSDATVAAQWHQPLRLSVENFSSAGTPVERVN
jgi:hypothetical protein